MDASGPEVNNRAGKIFGLISKDSRGAGLYWT
jgi:hypothetical protein